MVIGAPDPKALIPKIGLSSYHHVFCYSSESGNSVKRLKSDPDPDDKNQGGWQLSLRSLLIIPNSKGLKCIALMNDGVYL